MLPVLNLKLPDGKRRGPRVLVACHPRTFDDPTSPHWQNALIRNATEEEFPSGGSEAVFETVDTREGGDHQADIFQFSLPGSGPVARFMPLHKHAFDSVWLPDCDGKWAELSPLSKTQIWTEDAYSESIEDTLRVVMTLVRPGGLLHLGKPPENVDQFAARVLSMAVPNGLLDIESVEVKHAGLDADEKLSLWGVEKGVLSYVVVKKSMRS